MTAILKPLFGWRSALADSDLSPVTRHVALALSLYMNERGGSAFPGAPRLAHDTGLHVSTIRERLAELVAGGWLTLIEKGGQLGQTRHANVYEASVPLAVGDPSSVATRRQWRTDPSPVAHLPLAVGDPISSMNSPKNSGDSATNGAPDPRVFALVGGYVDDYRAERQGQDPARSFKASCGKAVKNALKDGVSAEDIARCLGVIAHESKNPSTLPYVLADFHAGRERRMK